MSGRLLEMATYAELRTAALQQLKLDWDHTSLICSTIAGALGTEVRPDQINPYRIEVRYEADWDNLKAVVANDKR